MENCLVFPIPSVSSPFDLWLESQFRKAESPMRRKEIAEKQYQIAKVYFREGEAGISDIRRMLAVWQKNFDRLSETTEIS